MRVESGVVIKDNVIIEKDCFIGAGAYLRGDVYLAESVIVGPGCEIKSSFIFKKTRIAHFNFVGDSIVGEDVNVEDGSIIANCFNESEKNIVLHVDNELVTTGVKKFGALVGDHYWRQWRFSTPN